MNFKARKAIDAGNYYATANVTAHIVPGAFLLDEENDEDYEDQDVCKWILHVMAINFDNIGRKK
jgi:hypothetical protein